VAVGNWAPDVPNDHGRSSLWTRTGETQELPEEGSRRIVTGDCPINAEKGVVVMEVSGEEDENLMASTWGGDGTETRAKNM